MASVKHKHKHSQKAWVVSVDMGYGHQRAAFPLRHLAYKKNIISANNYPGVPERDRRVWRESQRFYEFISRFKRVPVIGKPAWELYDSLQEIPKFYPKRDLSKMSLQVKQIYRLIEKRQWGKHLIDKLSKDPKPLITTFFIPAFMAEHFDYPGEIYCLATDTDINRAWAPKEPASSRIQYFAPNHRVVERLKLYGVAADKIFLTGFPLPLDNIGSDTMEILKGDIAQRLVNLDPDRLHWQRYKGLVKRYLGIKKLPNKSNHPLTVTFAVGGAGAQRDIGADIIKSLKNQIRLKKIRLVLVAGIHNNVAKFFSDAAVAAGLREELGRGIKIIFGSTKDQYFKKFDEALRTTDVLWTKPSELCFYAALGIPVIIAPPIGSQEHFNRRWLRTIGAGVTQENPKHADEWLLDWIHSGWFAEAAMEGFIEAPKMGTFNIENIINHRYDMVTEPRMLVQY